MTKKRVLYRLLHILLVVIGVSFLSFLLMYAAPGDPVRAMYAVSGSIPPEEVLEQTREEMGLNDPFLVQYVRWAAGCLRGDFGTSYSQGLAVSGLLLERVWPTVQLALLSLVMMVALAVPIGMFSALRQNTRLDYLLRTHRGKIDPDCIKECMKDHEYYPEAICNHSNHPGEDPMKGLMTVASIIVDFQKQQAHVCYGNPCEGQYKVYDL